MKKDGVLVRDVMSREVVTVRRNDQLALSDGAMQEHRVRHIPVLDDDDLLCGIISQRDLFRGMLLRSIGFGTRAEERLLESFAVKDAMIDDVFSTAADTPLKDAAALMLEHKIGCLPVVEGEGKVVGILTESDFVKLATAS